MKNIKPATKHIIVDARQDPEILGASVEYSTKEIESWIEKGLLPKRLRTVGRKWIKELNDKNKHTKKPIEAIAKGLRELEGTKNKRTNISDIENKTEFLDYLFKNFYKLKNLSTESPSHITCALPSSAPMLAFLALFAGLPARIPRKLLETKKEDQSPEDRDLKNKYLEQIFKTETNEDLTVTPSKITEKRMFLICNNNRLEGKANIDPNNFQNDLSSQEEQLAIYLKKTFGPEGLRHVIGLIIGLEENFRQGFFDWDIDEHLERLGYQRWQNGEFDPELKKTASQVIRILTGLSITSTHKHKNRNSIKDEYFFMVSKRERNFNNDILSEKIRLVATDLWYKNSLSNSEGKSPQYTKILKSVAKENHQKHPLTIYLSPLLAIFWRINKGSALFSIKVLMDWCDIYLDEKHRLENLRRLESELEYMKTKGYLGDFTNDNTASKFPSECTKPYECVLTLTPPDWLNDELQKIVQNHGTISPVKTYNILSHQEFIKIFKDFGMSQKSFAIALGITQPQVSALINGKRNISQGTSDKARFLKEKIHKVIEVEQPMAEDSILTIPNIEASNVPEKTDITN